MQTILSVHIGQVKVAKRGEILKAILGSCVGIAVLDKGQKICGLAHCLLPINPEPSFEIGARYVDQAFRSLIAIMKLKTEEAKLVSIVIVGGGNMTNVVASNKSELVGESNFRTAIEEAKKYNLKILYTEGGGNEGRKIYVDSSDLSYRIEKIPRIIKVG